MANNIVSEFGAMPRGDATSNGSQGLASETSTELIRRAKAIIAGTYSPPPLGRAPEVESFLQREFAAQEHPPTPETIRRISDRLTLEIQYQGQPIASVITANGSLAVLAAGSVEIELLLRGLTPDELGKVLVTDTMPC